MLSFADVFCGTYFDLLYGTVMSPVCCRPESWCSVVSGLLTTAISNEHQHQAGGGHMTPPSAHRTDETEHRINLPIRSVKRLSYLTKKPREINLKTRTNWAKTNCFLLDKSFCMGQKIVQATSVVVVVNLEDYNQLHVFCCCQLELKV